MLLSSSTICSRWSLDCEACLPQFVSSKNVRHKYWWDNNTLIPLLEWDLGLCLFYFINLHLFVYFCWFDIFTNLLLHDPLFSIWLIHKIELLCSTESSVLGILQIQCCAICRKFVVIGFAAWLQVIPSSSGIFWFGFGRYEYTVCWAVNS